MYEISSETAVLICGGSNNTFALVSINDEPVPCAVVCGVTGAALGALVVASCLTPLHANPFPVYVLLQNIGIGAIGGGTIGGVAGAALDWFMTS